MPKSIGLRKGKWYMSTKKKAKHSKKRQFIGGKTITRKQALAGLGDEKTWEADAKELQREFRKKPKTAI